MGCRTTTAAATSFSSSPLLILLAGLLAAVMVAAGSPDLDLTQEVQRDFRMGLFARQATPLNLQVRALVGAESRQ